MKTRILCAGAALSGALSLAAWSGVQAQQDDVVLDEDVRVVHFEDLYYPIGLRSARVQGVVVVAVKLDERGDVASASAVSGPSKLITYAVANAQKWKFEPNRQRKAVIVYEFHIDAGTCHDSTRSLFLLKHNNFASIKSCENPVGR